MARGQAEAEHRAQRPQLAVSTARKAEAMRSRHPASRLGVRRSASTRVPPGNTAFGRAKLSDVSEFDEMLRAGLISPGSQPHVESKKPTPSGEGLPSATVTVVSETRTSKPVDVDQQALAPTASASPAFVVILGGERLDVARKAKDALSIHYQSHVTRPLTDF